MRKLTRKQEILYAFAGFGPNLLLILITAYIVDAFRVEGFGKNAESWTFSNMTIVVTSAFIVLMTIAKVIDGVIDIPLAGLTDNLKTKWGRRRPSIAIAMIPMIASYFMICCPLQPNVENSVANTVWAFLSFTLLVVSYTLCLVTYYATFAEITRDAQSRMRLSSYKAFFDTIGYSIAYALIPLFVGMHINIQTIALTLSPLLLTMIIPLFVIKEPSTLPADVQKAAEEAKARALELGDKVESDSELSEAKEAEIAAKDKNFWKSFGKAFTNKNYMIWMGVFSLFFFGLQMFLAGQNVLASGAMGFTGWQIAVMNSAAFAPVPLMLWLYNKVVKKKGFAFSFRTSIVSFMIAMASFAIAYVNWIPSFWARFIIAIAGSTVGSYGIGSFFSAPYFVNAQLASENRKNGDKNTSTFFVVQGLFNAVMGALATTLIWQAIRGIAWENEPFFGPHLMPFIVIGACAISLVISIFLPKFFTELGKIKKDGTMVVGESTAPNTDNKDQ